MYVINNSMKHTTPYTYYIEWSSPKMRYYGARWAKNCHPKDLWITYFTSSDYVTKFRKIYGEPDKIKVCKKFKSRKAVLKWERKFLSRVDARNRNDFLNMTNGFENVWDSSGQTWYNDGVSEFYLPKHSTEKLKIGRLPKSNDVKMKTSKTLSKLKWFNNGVKNVRMQKCPDGYKSGRLRFNRIAPSIETRRKMSETSRGRHLSEAHKSKISNNMSGRKWFNNGVKNVFQEKCPNGFEKGRLKKFRN